MAGMNWSRLSTPLSESVAGSTASAGVPGKWPYHHHTIQGSREGLNEGLFLKKKGVPFTEGLGHVLISCNWVWTPPPPRLVGRDMLSGSSEGPLRVRESIHPNPSLR